MSACLEHSARAAAVVAAARTSSTRSAVVAVADGDARTVRVAELRGGQWGVTGPDRRVRACVDQVAAVHAVVGVLEEVAAADLLTAAVSHDWARQIARALVGGAA